MVLVLAIIMSGQQPCSSSTSLSLNSKYIEDEEVKDLAYNTNLTDLDLCYNNIGARGARALAYNLTLTSLHLIGNNIGDEGAIALIDLFRNYNICVYSKLCQ